MIVKVILILVTLSRVNCNQSGPIAYEIEEIKGDSGLYYERLDTIHWYRSEWKIAIALATEDLLKEYRLKTQFENVLDTCHSKLNKPLCEGAIDYNWVLELNRTLNKIHHQIRSLINSYKFRELTRRESSRHGRLVLFGVVGSVSKMLFGVSTFDDFKETKENVDQLFADNQKLAKIVGKQSHVMVENFETFKIAINEQDRRTNEIESEIKDHGLLDMIDETRYANNLSLYSTALERHLEHLIRASEKLLNILQDAEMGRVSPHLLTNPIINAISDDIRRELDKVQLT